MAELKIEAVSKIYPGGVSAVRELDLLIRDEEFLVLVGPSGCGKSTTLRMIAGLEDVSEGTIEIGGRTVNELRPRDRDIAMVFQDYALYPHMTVYKNMAFGLRLRGQEKTEIDARVRRAAEILGILDLLARKPKALSGGQRQRVALGRAIVRDPAAFLFDEPLSNLDARLRVTMRAELKRLHRQLRTTTVYVTHDQEEAMTLGDRVAVMAEGRIQQCDTPLRVYQAPVNRFVAGFLGMPPMNFIEGRLSQIDGKTLFEGGGLRLALAPCAIEHGAPVVLGLRPEALQPFQGESSASLGALTVEVVEPLGSVMDVSLRSAEGTRLTARMKAAPLDEGAELKLMVDPDLAQLFAPGPAGRNLLLSSPA